MVEEFGEVLIGKDPHRIEQHWQTLYHHFHVRGGVVQLSAISGIELSHSGTSKAKPSASPSTNSSAARCAKRSGATDAGTASPLD